MSEAGHNPFEQREHRYHHGDLRAALLKSAEHELQEHGIEGFSLRSVAKRAGVSHAAPAHHFSDVKGLLTALATEGFRRFVDTQKLAMQRASPEPIHQLAASGVGYVRFAVANTALFRLIFSSDRPDFDDTALAEAASAAFCMLVEQVEAVTGKDPQQDPKAMADVVATWSIAHGLADLIAAGRLDSVASMPEQMRDEFVHRLVTRAIPENRRA